MSSLLKRLRDRSAGTLSGDDDGRAMLVYDGGCGFCTRCARWVEAHAHDVDVVAWQSLDLAEVGLTEQQVREAAYWLEGSRVEGAERAVARALMRCGRGYAVAGRALLLPGIRRASAPAYRFVAAHRSWFSALVPRR